MSWAEREADRIEAAADELGQLRADVNRLTAELERWRSAESTFLALAFDYVKAEPGTDAVEQAWYQLKGAVEHWEAVEQRRATETGAALTGPLARPALPWTLQTPEGYRRLRVHVWPSLEQPYTGAVTVSDSWSELTAEELEQGADAMREAARRIRIARGDPWTGAEQRLEEANHLRAVAVDNQLRAAAYDAVNGWRWSLRESLGETPAIPMRALAEAVDAHRALGHTASDANQVADHRPAAPVTLYLTDPRDTLKMVRETLCLASTGLGGRTLDEHRIAGDVDRISRIIAEIDRQRPLGQDGKHGDLHTPTCGCEDVCRGDRQEAEA